jgi:lipase chaperone LimK
MNSHLDTIKVHQNNHSCTNLFIRLYLSNKENTIFGEEEDENETKK